MVWLCDSRQVCTKRCLHWNSLRLTLRFFHRALAMTFGRPCTIPENFVKLELPSERDFYPIPGISSSSEARNNLNVHFYVSSM